MANRLYNKQVSPKGYQKGGRVAKMGGGMMMKRPMMNKGGKTLKPVNPETQVGLSRLPKEVRNKMGYMKKGGRVGLKDGSKDKPMKVIDPVTKMKKGPMKVKRPETKFSPELKKKIEKSMLKMQSEKLRRKVR
jgi:hypothetical protein